MSEITITFPDNSKKQYKKGITPLEIAKSIGERLAMASLAAKVKDKLVDMSHKIHDDSRLQILTYKDKEGQEVFRHSAAHLMAHAITLLYKDAKLTIGPVTEDGFYYDIDFRPFTPEDISKIEKMMEELVKTNSQFDRIELTKKEALMKFKGNEYKTEIITQLAPEETISAYAEGDFLDLCRGPHLPSTGHIKAFKITKLAGAYWRGDSKNKMLQRVYGIAFPEKKLLDEYLKRIEEAEKRDHRKISKELDLAYFHEFAPGAPFYLKKGTIIYNILVDFIREEYRLRGYEEVITPQMYNKKLWEQSGHWEHYKENMFIINVEGEEHSLKPMNCPSHCLIFNRDTKSYRDLPVRIADFCNLHRNELSGTLSGMFRVRKFAQDDSHIFCRFDQIEAEVQGVLEFIKYVWEDVFGFKLTYYLSTMPEKALGTKEMWDDATAYLENALKKANIKYAIKPGDGAFYGPKIDIDIEDALGRKWQCPTCQLDFNLPERFNTQYEGQDGKKHRAIMIHRAVLGSLERFMGIMIENYAGRFPLWLSPVQVILLNINDSNKPFVEEVRKKLFDNRIRVEVNTVPDTINKKVRDAQLQQIPLIVTIGDKEVEQKTLAVRTLDGKVKMGVKVEDFIKFIKDNVEKKKINLDF